MVEMVSIRCVKCYGQGTIRKRDMVSRITFVRCKFCYGSGRRWAARGSGEHRVAANMGAMGLWPGITKHSNDRGWNRR